MIALGVGIVLILAASLLLMILVFAEDLGEHDGLATSSPAETITKTPCGPAKGREAAFGPGDVRELPAGLFCRDLLARQYSYVAAIDYWRQHGQPNQMDVERNGIPCETVFPFREVSYYWYG